MLTVNRLCVTKISMITRPFNRFFGFLLPALMATIFIFASLSSSLAEDAAANPPTPRFGTNVASAENCESLIAQRGSIGTLDWKRITTQKQLESCALTVAAELGDRFSLIEWFELNGFKTAKPITLPATSMVHFTDVPGAGWQISGTIRRRDLDKDFNIWKPLFAYAFTLGVTLDANQMPVRSQAGFSQK